MAIPKHSITPTALAKGSSSVPEIVQGDVKNLPGQNPAPIRQTDFGSTSEIVSSTRYHAAYSGHGKVRVGSTSDL